MMSVPERPVKEPHRHADISTRPRLVVATTLLLACNGGAMGASTAASAAGATTEVATDSDAAEGSTQEPTIASGPAGSTSGTSGTSGTSDPASSTGSSGATTGGETGGTTGGAACEPGERPMALWPCEAGSCWSTLTFSGICGATDVEEDFASGAYNVHRFELRARAGVAVTLTLRRTGGDFDPALVIHDELGATLYDGELGVCAATGPSIAAISTGSDSDTASVKILPESDMKLAVFLSGWHVVDSDFAAPMPEDATYAFRVDNDCEAEVGAMDPPNFVEDDVEGGFHLLPDSAPAGLYEHKDDDCSRGTRRLVQVLYTVAARWNELRPEFSPIAIRDLTEAWCSSVDHATHDDGTHADLVADCATDNSCGDWIPAVDLARLFIDTGEVCGILFVDTTVQAPVNAYFAAHQQYEPWKQVFMRSVDGHVHHFHVRVKKPDGTCN